MHVSSAYVRDSKWVSDRCCATTVPTLWVEGVVRVGLFKRQKIESEQLKWFRWKYCSYSAICVVCCCQSGRPLSGPMILSCRMSISFQKVNRKQSETVLGEHSDANGKHALLFHYKWDDGCLLSHLTLVVWLKWDQEHFPPLTLIWWGEKTTNKQASKQTTQALKGRCFVRLNVENFQSEQKSPSTLESSSMSYLALNKLKSLHPENPPPHCRRVQFCTDNQISNARTLAPAAKACFPASYLWPEWKWYYSIQLRIWWGC